MAGRASFGGTCDFDFQPVSPTTLPGLHGKEAMFGEKRMSVQREQLAGKLSRSCRINEGRPSLLASTALTGESTYHFRHKGAPAISHSVADRNEVVEKNSKAIQHFCVVGTPRDKTRRVSEVASTKAPVVDSKALSAEIDSVVMELRNLIAGDTEHSLNPGMVKSNTTEVRKDDDEEEGQSLHAKLLRYRYVRKIEAPPPPLEPLEGSYLKTPREVDKMEKNLQTFRIGWKRDALVRAQHWNRETSERTSTARFRRAEDSERFEHNLVQQMAMKERIPQRVEALRSAQVEKLRAKAAAREEKLEQVRRRRQEEREIKQQNLREMLSVDRRGKERTTTGLQEGCGSLTTRPSQEELNPEDPRAGAFDTAEDGGTTTDKQEDGIDWFQSLKEEDEEEDAAIAQGAPEE